MKKFIFICLAKTHRNMIERFYLDILFDAGIDIEYWDLRGVFYDENYNYDFDFITKINSIEEFKFKLKDLDPSKVILNIQFTYQFKYWEIFFHTRKFIISFYSVGNIPKQESNLSQNYLEKFKKIFSKKLFEKIFSELIRKVFLKDLDICFYAGNKSKELIVAQKYCPINYFDYEKQISVKKSQKDFKYALFLDLNLPRHPDFKELGLSYIEEELYFKQLKTLFQSIEDQFGLKVIVALHPTSNGLEFHPKELQYKDSINELVANCEFAITHYSTSICTVVSSYKPLVLVITEDIKDKIPYSSSVIYGYANALDLEVLHLEKNNRISSLPSINTKFYSSFLDKYYTNEDTKNKYANKYLVEYLKEL